MGSGLEALCARVCVYIYSVYGCIYIKRERERVREYLYYIYNVNYFLCLNLLMLCEFTYLYLCSYLSGIQTQHFLWRHCLSLLQRTSSILGNWRLGETFSMSMSITVSMVMHIHPPGVSKGCQNLPHATCFRPPTRCAAEFGMMTPTLSPALMPIF